VAARRPRLRLRHTQVDLRVRPVISPSNSHPFRGCGLIALWSRLYFGVLVRVGDGLLLDWCFLDCCCLTWVSNPVYRVADFAFSLVNVGLSPGFCLMRSRSRLSRGILSCGNHYLNFLFSVFFWCAISNLGILQALFRFCTPSLCWIFWTTDHIEN